MGEPYDTIQDEKLTQQNGNMLPQYHERSAWCHFTLWVWIVLTTIQFLCLMGSICSDPHPKYSPFLAALTCLLLHWATNYTKPGTTYSIVVKTLAWSWAILSLIYIIFEGKAHVYRLWKMFW